MSPAEVHLCKEASLLGIQVHGTSGTSFKFTSADGSSIATDPVIIAAIVDSHEESQVGLYKAVFAPLTILSLGLFLVAIPRLNHLAVLLAPILFTLSSLALGVPCVACASVTFRAANILPIGLLGIAVMVAWLTWRQSSRPVLSAGALAFIGLGILLTECVMQIAEPKFCPWCILSGALAVALVQHGRSAFESGRFLTFGVPRFVWTSGTVLLALTTTVHAMTMTGRYDPTTFPPARMVDIQLNRPVSAYLKNNGNRDYEGILMVSLPGCHACDLAKTNLNQAATAYNVIEPCSMLSQATCFDPQGEALATPTFLLIDKQHVIRFRMTGWDPRSSLNTLHRLLSQMEEKTHEN